MRKQQAIEFSPVVGLREAMARAIVPDVAVCPSVVAGAVGASGRGDVRSTPGCEVRAEAGDEKESRKDG